MTDIKLSETLICDNMIGVIVADIDNHSYSDEYPQSDWEYLQTGFLINTQEAGLLHYPNRHNAIIEKANIK